MKLDNKREVVSLISLLSSNPSQEIFELYGNNYERVQLLISLRVAVDKLTLSAFSLLNTMYSSVISELEDYFFFIHKYELDCMGEDNTWVSCGRLKGKYLSLSQAMQKVSHLEEEGFMYRIVGEKK